jgi:hypothetical protein
MQVGRQVLRFVTMRTIKSERRKSSSNRVPTVAPGEAIIYTRYDREKSVVMNPEDFHRLADLDRDLAVLVSGRIRMSDLALEAHLHESTPGTAIEDPAEIEAILGL